MTGSPRSHDHTLTIFSLPPDFIENEASELWYQNVTQSSSPRATCPQRIFKSLLTSSLHSITRAAARRRTQLAELLAHLSISVEKLTSHELQEELHMRRLAAALLALRLGLHMRAFSASMWR